MSQLGFFDDPAPAAELTPAPPSGLCLGTSSWTFPGWAGVVYPASASAKQLSGSNTTQALSWYARNPLLNAVGVDSSFYRAPPLARWQDYARAVPEGFRFLVKGERDVLDPQSPRFLDPDYALEQVLRPCAQGLGDKLAVVLWQFSPMPTDPALVPRTLDFLRATSKALSGTVAMAVEWRHPGTLTPSWQRSLRELGVQQCIAEHPQAPSLTDQLRCHNPDAPWMVMRWMLQRRLRYQQAKAQFSPFNALQQPDPRLRAWWVERIQRALDRGQQVIFIANNKAEGSSPLSLRELCRETHGVTDPTRDIPTL